MTEVHSSETGEALTREGLAQAVWDAMRPASRGDLTLEDLTHVTAKLDLDGRHDPAPPALRIVRLRLQGVKRRPSQQDEPFTYDQPFAAGVNVLHIPDNSVGKSTVLKSIKFALTADDDGYEVDVRSWIDEVRLTFVLGSSTFTVLHRRDRVLRTLLVGDAADLPFDEVELAAERAYISTRGAEEAQAELQRFFFQRLGLEPLSWTNQDRTTGVSLSSTSWLTYFQALFMRDDSDHYLLVDGAHNIGNQGGLILSAFLGLNLAAPLNSLAITEQTARKTAREITRRTDEDRTNAEAQGTQIAAQVAATEDRLKTLRLQLRERQREFTEGPFTQKLSADQTDLFALHAERGTLERSRAELNSTIQQLRALEKRLREAADFALHFSSLEVDLCPNCEHGVDAQALERERTEHTCRLCGKAAQAADSHELQTLEADADAAKQDRLECESKRSAINEQLRQIANTISTTEIALEALHVQAARSVTAVLPNETEQAELDHLADALGTLRAQQHLLAASTASADQKVAELDRERRAADAVRKYLAREAAARNTPLLTRLSELTEQAAQEIGAQSVTDIAVGATGTISLMKYGQRVSFDKINNTGDRLRVKLAFFLAMIRLSREAGYGRHPGLLLIDQPGSAEMVDEDFEALARILRRVDNTVPGIQIICATARRGFNATRPDRTYGPQNPPNAF